MDTITADLPQFLRLIMALCFVLLLMGGLAMGLKKLGLSAHMSVKSGDKKRLKILETLPLDARRRMAIVQCDQQEHLIILGANTETVIDTNIQAVDHSHDSRANA